MKQRLGRDKVSSMERKTWHIYSGINATCNHFLKKTEVRRKKERLKTTTTPPLKND